MPADASSAIPLALDQLREVLDVGPGEVPGLLERPTQVPDPRDPRGLRHALTSCAVPAGATSLPAVGERTADAPPQVLERLGVRPDPVLPRRLVPAEATVRRLLTRIDGDALDRGGGRMARRPSAPSCGPATRPAPWRPGATLPLEPCDCTA
ncbi:transposase family protein [Streptomyces sp. NPDC005492]|uniref:transposase family protein n=1 Tax=Streptomyces sp. NPDC005492 TaxID=3156883 RepID=UPI0033B9BC3F